MTASLLRPLHLVLILVLFSLHSALSWAREVNFDDIFVDDAELQDHIPKVSHFVFSQLKELSWLEYAAIKSSLVNMGVEKINLWMPPESVPTGEVWEAVLALPGATIREVEMPTKIYGHDVSVLAHISDIVRLEAVYNEGGIYMDYNLIALRSSDPVIFDPSTNATVMAREVTGLCNALIMSKKHAPFLKTWMSAYVDFKDEEWMSMSVHKPWELANQGNQDLTILDLSTWFSPTFLDKYNVWLGQSYTEIDANHGLHMWGTYRYFYPLMTPETVREIDTPLFCRVRHLFDNIRGSYVAPDWRSNPNCSFMTMSQLHNQNHLLMGSYNFAGDSSIKIIDSSGNNLHGWAPFGTGQFLEDGAAVRAFRENENAWLPFPVDYDGRVGTIAVKMMLQADTQHDSNVTFAMLRLDDREVHVYWRFVYNKRIDKSAIEIEWRHENNEEASFTLFCDVDIPIHDDKYHNFSFAWDRRDVGQITLRVDNVEISREHISPYNRVLRGYELWLNSISDEHMDMDLRARLRKLETYGEALFEYDAILSYTDSGPRHFPVRPGKKFLSAAPGLVLGVPLTAFFVLLWLRSQQKRPKRYRMRGNLLTVDLAIEYERLIEEVKSDNGDRYHD